MGLFRAVGSAHAWRFPHGGENLPEKPKGSTKLGRVFTHLLCLPRLSLCEKALAEYLDMKRLAFPRFYFISSADLLDILSNGTNPHLVRLVVHCLCIFQLSQWKVLSWDSPWCPLWSDFLPPYVG